MFLIIFLLFVLWENTMNWIWIETENKKKSAPTETIGQQINKI